MPLTTDVAPLVFDHFDCQAFDANTAARRLFGDLAAVNVPMLGFAFQRGCLPLSEHALRRAIERWRLLRC